MLGSDPGVQTRLETSLLFCLWHGPSASQCFHDLDISEEQGTPFPKFTLTQPFIAFKTHSGMAARGREEE